MPHADFSRLPGNLPDKPAFYEYARAQLMSLLEDERHWLPLLSNAASLLYHLLNDWLPEQPVNWAGFYVNAEYLFGTGTDRLILGPFHGRPACQYVRLTGTLGVCATAYLKQEGRTLVKDVHAHPGHIACDAATKSEIVVPLGQWGVLDLDSTQKAGFDEEDAQGLIKFVEVLESKLRNAGCGPHDAIS